MKREHRSLARRIVEVYPGAEGVGGEGEGEARASRRRVIIRSVENERPIAFFDGHAATDEYTPSMKLRPLARLASLTLLGAINVACDPGSASCDTCRDTPITRDEKVAGWGPSMGSALGGAGGVGSVTGTPVETFGQLQVTDGILRSESGDLVQLKGVSSMWLNWENDGYAESLASLEYVRDEWHLSVIRAAMGITPGGAYLSNPEHAEAQVRTIVENAIAAGVYVIIDWHDHNAHEYQAEAEAFFSKMAEDYGDYPNVMYETYNEPLDVSWHTTLKPYHEAVVGKIREHDPDNIVILGTSNWSQDVDIAALSPLEGKNLMYTLHFYACSHASVRSKGAEAIRRGLPLFITEWGGTHADGGTDGIVCEPETRAWDEWMDLNAISWTAWKLDNCAQDSSCLLQPNAPVDGPWTDEYLHGHATLVREMMRD